MLSRQEEEQERRETFENDLRAREQQKQREQGSTFLDQYHSHTGGRFGAIQQESVTGRVSPKPPPLPASSPWSGAQPEPGIEPPTGYAIHQVEPLESPSFAQGQLGAPAAEVAPPPDRLPPVTGGVEPGAGAPPSSETDDERLRRAANK